MLNFLPFAELHFPLFESWLQQEHVKRFWTESKTGDELREKLLATASKTHVHRFVIEKDGDPIGYIQYYDAIAVGEDWWRDEKAGTFGMDLFIGDKNQVGIGIGPKVIREFVAHLLNQEPNARSIIIDPAPQNQYAIRAYEKAGFVREKEVTTPDGPAVLMRMPLPHR